MYVMRTFAATYSVAANWLQVQFEVSKGSLTSHSQRPKRMLTDKRLVKRNHVRMVGELDDLVQRLLKPTW